MLVFGDWRGYHGFQPVLCLHVFLVYVPYVSTHNIPTQNNTLLGQGARPLQLVLVLTE